MKLWLANYPLVYTVPTESDRYNWNGICLDLQNPEWYDDKTPSRKTDIRRGMNGRAVITTDSFVERYELSLHVQNITEKEKIALEEFLAAVGIHSVDQFPYPFVRYQGFQDHDESLYVMIFMQQELTFTEISTTNAKLDELLITDRRYNVDIPVRITRSTDKWQMQDSYWMKIYWLNEDEEEINSIKLSYESLPQENIYGWIENFSGFSQSSQIHGFGAVANVTLSLAAYKQINTLPEDHPFHFLHKHIEGITEAHVEIYYRHNNKDIIAFKGRAYSPFKWEESSRQISFDAMMNSRSKYLGFQPDFDGNLLIRDNMNKENWPHVFGQGMFKFTPFCKRPEAQITHDIYVTEDFSDPLNNIYASGQAWHLPIDPENPLPVGPYQYFIPVEGGGIRVVGSAAGSTLTIQNFNVPYHSNITVYQIPQYDPGFQYKRDGKNYQPNTLFVDGKIPYIAGMHIRAEAKRSYWAVNSGGRFIEYTETLIYWATVAEQTDNILYLTDIRNLDGKTITLSGWATLSILEVMENRLFQPNSYLLNNTEEIQEQRTKGHRKMYVENEDEQYLAVQIRGRSSVVCVNWLLDKVYPISLDVYTRVNNAFFEVDHRLYWVPMYKVYSYTKEGGLVVVQDYQTEWAEIDWDIYTMVPFLPDECILLVLYEHYGEIQGDVVNDLTDDHAVFDFVLQKYTELEPGVHTSEQLPTDFMVRHYQDARQWLAHLCMERAKRVVVQRQATAYTSPLDPPVSRVYTNATVELDSISYESMGIEEIVNKFKMTSEWAEGTFWILGDQKYPEAEEAYTIWSYWNEETWRYWVNWKSKLWRKVTFRAFMQDYNESLPPNSPLEKIRLETSIFTGNGIIEDIRTDGNMLTITMISEEEVI